MRKAEKRRLGEEKAKQEAADRLASGLAAQKADREARKKREDAVKVVTTGMNQKHRTSLLNRGINPSTGEVFTIQELAEMEKKANTPERRDLLKRIHAGRAGTLNEEPPLNMSDYLDDPFGGMTVGEFRAASDKHWADFQEALRTKKNEPKMVMETQSALKLFSNRED